MRLEHALLFGAIPVLASFLRACYSAIVYALWHKPVARKTHVESERVERSGGRPVLNGRRVYDGRWEVE
jgi:hypothetical protein